MFGALFVILCLLINKEVLKKKQRNKNKNKQEYVNAHLASGLFVSFDLWQRSAKGILICRLLISL